MDTNTLVKTIMNAAKHTFTPIGQKVIQNNLVTHASAGTSIRFVMPPEIMVCGRCTHAPNYTPSCTDLVVDFATNTCRIERDAVGEMVGFEIDPASIEFATR